MKISRDELQSLYNDFYETNHSIVSKHNDKFYWAKGRHTSLLLDELNRAPLDIRQTALQLVLNKEIHEHELPWFKGKPTLITACINPEDGYQVQSMDPALLDRFLTLEVQVDAHEWIKYARARGLDNALISFIIDNPDKLHCKTDNDNDKKYPTPRAWTKLSDILKNTKNAKTNPLTLDLIKGKIGDTIGTRFYSYFCKYEEQLTLERVKEFIENHPSDNTEAVAEDLKVLMKDLDVMVKKEMTETVANEELSSDSDGKCTFSLLWMLEMESRGSILSYMKHNDLDKFKKLLELDGKERKLTKSVTDYILKSKRTS